MAKMPGIPPLERQQEYEKARRQSLALHGIPDPSRPLHAETTPLTEYSPKYVWDAEAFRYRWRKGTKRGGKDVSWHFCPVPRQERRVYAERLKWRRRHQGWAEGGSRLKAKPPKGRKR